MASRYVRSKVREWLSQGSIKFYDTVNNEVDPSDLVWNTVDWTYSTRTADGYCRNIEEGSFTIEYFGRPGIGDDSLLKAAEEHIEAFMKQADEDSKLFLINFDPPSDFRESEYYIVEVVVSYEYRN